MRRWHPIPMKELVDLTPLLLVLGGQGVYDAALEGALGKKSINHELLPMQLRRQVALLPIPGPVLAVYVMLVRPWSVS